MGDAVNVSWTDGPTSKEIDEIVQKYQRGHFDGMEDMYKDHYYDGWTNTFGGTKYANTHREISSQRVAEAAAELGFDDVPYSELSTDTQQEIRQQAYSKSYYEAPAADQEPAEEPEVNGEVNIIVNEAKNGIEIRFSEKPYQGILEILRQNGFRWHRKRKFWYAKQSDKTWAAANDIASRFNIEIKNAA